MSTSVDSGKTGRRWRGGAQAACGFSRKVVYVVLCHNTRARARTRVHIHIQSRTHTRAHARTRTHSHVNPAMEP